MLRVQEERDFRTDDAIMQALFPISIKEQPGSYVTCLFELIP